MNSRNENHGAMFSLGDGLVGINLSTLVSSEGRSQFAVLGRNPKTHSEVHFIEYRPELATIADLKVQITQDRLYKVGSSKSASGILLTSGKDASGEFFSIADATLGNFGDITSKEAGYRLTKDAFSKKGPINTLSKEYTGFRVSDFVSKANSPKVIILGERTLTVRDLPQNRLESTINVNREGLLENLASDPHSDRVAFSSHRSIVLTDLRAASANSSLNIEMAHLEGVNSLEFNPNKNHTLLSSSYDHNLKVWDLRKPELPVLIFTNHSNPIESCHYNPVYDQLLLYSTSDGGMTLYQAGSASTQPTADLEENEPTDYVVAAYEGCLDDVVKEVAWSHGDYWVFSGVSHSASIYCDIVPEREKQRIIL